MKIIYEFFLSLIKGGLATVVIAILLLAAEIISALDK